MGDFHYPLPCDLNGKNVAINRGPLKIRDITACRFAKVMPRILSHKFRAEVDSQEEQCAEAKDQHESSEFAKKTHLNEVIM